MAMPSLAQQIVFLAAAACAGYILGRVARTWRPDPAVDIRNAARLIVETMPYHAWVNDRDGNLEYVNPSLMAYFGFPEEYYDLKKAGTPDFQTAYREMLADVIHPDDFEASISKWGAALADGRPHFLDHRLRGADGRHRWFRVTAYPFGSGPGGTTFYYGTQVDVNHEFELQRALSDARGRLADAAQIARLAEISTSIASEIGEPLARSHLAALKLQDHLHSDAMPDIGSALRLADEIAADAESSGDIIRRMRRLLEERRGGMVLADFSNAVEEVCRALTSDAEAKGLRIQMQLDTVKGQHFEFDPTQIRQLVLNLVINAIEATDPAQGDDPVILVRATQDGSQLVLTVADDGPGIDTAAPVFDPFFSTKPGGLGMGLAVCRSITEAHGGELHVVANGARGSLFTFAMPIEAAGRRNPEGGGARAHGTGGASK
ncbi:MAG: ATP-binding protein [Sphingopyxis sp.]|nr:ATP-binding protein [Sphingopyxis sp.]